MIAVCLLLLTTYQSHADTAYVTDAVTVAIFETDKLKGEPVERLVSGSLVDRLQSHGLVTEVRSGSGKTGWLRTTFLTTVLPASIKLENADNEISKLNSKLKSANEKIAALEGAASAASKDSGWMKVEMEKARSETKSLKSQLKKIQAQSSSVDKQTETFASQLTRLEAEKADLEQRLAATLMINNDPEIEKSVSESGFPWSFAALILGLLAGFGAGYAWVDNRVRKRFGGIRVY